MAPVEAWRFRPISLLFGCLCEQMTVAKLATDEYDSLLVDKVPFLSKLNVQRQPRSST